MHIRCSIMNNGTRKVGIRLRGNTVMAAIEGPCGSSKPAVVPRLTAVIRSSIPSACQKMKLLRCAGSASFQAANPAVAPMNMSPYPAGKAKIAGNTFRACSRKNVNPTILHTCTEVRIFGFNDNAKFRNPSDTANHSENTIRGASDATATPNPNRADPFSNKCASAAKKAATNQAASKTAVILPYLVITNLLENWQFPLRNT